MTVKTLSQRSISDLDRFIKHEVLRHQNQQSDTWSELNLLLCNEETLHAYCDCSVQDGCFHDNMKTRTFPNLKIRAVLFNNNCYLRPALTLSPKQQTSFSHIAQEFLNFIPNRISNVPKLRLNFFFGTRRPSWILKPPV